MPTFVEIAVNIPNLSGVFHYHLPPELEGRVSPGHVVAVPFGKQTVQGVVVRRVETPGVPETRPVAHLIDPEAALTPPQLALAAHLAETTLAPLAACLGLMLPPGLGQVADAVYRIDLQRPPDATSTELNDLQRRILALLERKGELSGRQLERALPHFDWRPAMRSLVRKGLVSSQPVLPAPSVHPKVVRTARLAFHPDNIDAHQEQLGRRSSPAAQRRLAILRFLAREGSPVDVSWIYAESGGNSADLRFLADRSLIALGAGQIFRDPLQEVQFVPDQPPQLIAEQESAWQVIRDGMRQAYAGQAVAPFLLHGVTGSGKTEVYLAAVAEVLRARKQAIVLVPEIALTPQNVLRFLARFPDQVGLVHSGLSLGERYDTWRRARQRDLSVIIGPRSALFLPLPDLGLIVVDECHDDSYYQSDSLPYYHAREAAVAYARLSGAICLLGSATPDLISQYRAERSQYRYLHLPDRILAHRQAVQSQVARHSLQGKRLHYTPLESQAETAELPPVHIVDMRQELKAGNRSIFSRDLQAALQHVLENDQQAILFLNRRGAGTYVFCRECGYSLRCPRCDTPLVYHDPPRSSLASQEPEEVRLTCHRCGYQRKMPGECPRCGSQHIQQYGTGTQRVEAEVQRLYPGVRTLRWDRETTRQKGAHAAILSHFTAHRADILIGTQMLAKGLDLPLVTLVGVVLADVGLNLPDYRAAERSFAVLTQVAGRAGRSPLGGAVYLQTFQPEHYVIQAAASHDYFAFYRQELAFRHKLGYPPFTQLVRLEVRSSRPAEAEQAALQLARRIQIWMQAEDLRATEMIGPVPCFYTRLAGQYRWQIILRGPDPAAALRRRELGGLSTEIRPELRIEVNPPNLL